TESSRFHSIPSAIDARSEQDRPRSEMKRPPRKRGRSSLPRKELRPLFQSDSAWVFAAALLVRLLYLFSIRHAYFVNHPQTEALHDPEWATLILDAPVRPAPPFEQAPGYPYFVAAVYALLGRRIMAVALVQAVLDAASCSLLAAAGSRWFGRRVGVLAGVM